MVVGPIAEPRFPWVEHEVLERFAAQAAAALQTSRIMTSEQRMVGQLAMLNRISDSVQAATDLEKILHIVLTGVTADYGLGLNRAGLLLLDESGEYLVGHMGIGHLEEDQARKAWTEFFKDGMDDPSRYLESLLNSLKSRSTIISRCGVLPCRK